MLNKNEKKGCKNGPGEAKTAPGGAPAEVPRITSSNRRSTARNNHANGSNIASQIGGFVVFLFYFQFPYDHLLDALSKDLPTVVGSFLALF